jgi:hypothetical protein
VKVRVNVYLASDSVEINLSPKAEEMYRKATRDGDWEDFDDWIREDVIEALDIDIESSDEVE